MGAAVDGFAAVFGFCWFGLAVSRAWFCVSGFVLAGDAGLGFG